MEEWISYLHTITSDKGKEFAGHLEVVEFLNITTILLIRIMLGKAVLMKN